MAEKRKNARSTDSATKSGAEEIDEHSGRGWHGNSVGHAEAGRKGGEAVARNREHMAAIGRKGGEAVSRDRRHMAEIGRRGGHARGGKSEGSTSDQNGSRQETRTA